MLKARPKRGALVRYGDRIAQVLGEARGERVMSASECLHDVIGPT